MHASKDSMWRVLYKIFWVFLDLNMALVNIEIEKIVLLSTSASLTEE
jgi:hypothetical protein